ncbi:MAG: GNAT family N-acetyltransferase [Planctomycetes bacterium]|nr:GNAT family N-acetyltransferase [Planctomycetota bacterium]
MARGAFKEFLVTIHGLDLSEWESAGYWDYAYTPFSLFDGDQVVSSVCVYSLQAVVDGEPARVAQFSGVGTLPAWRRKGLNRQLTDRALEWAGDAHRAVFLFADTDAIAFYTACGFTPIDECVEVMAARPVASKAGAVKLDPGRDEHLDRIYRYAERRSPASDKFSVLSPKLFAFHCLYSLKDCVYEIPDLECLVCYERVDGCLKILDILSERMPAFEQIYPYIACDGDREIEFHFHADKLGSENLQARALHGNNPFVKGAFPMKNPVFPFTCRA